MSISSIGNAGIQSWQTQRLDPAKMASDLFSKLNTDGSGGINGSELEGALSSTSGMSSTEVGSAATSMINGLDSDGDGQISQDELTSGFRQLAQQFDDHFNASRTSGMGQPPSPQQVLSGIDSDSSGGISQSELATAFGATDTAAGTSGTGSTDASSNASSNASALFKALDTNGDGSISQDELASAMQKLGGHGHGHRGMHNAEGASGASSTMAAGAAGAAGGVGATGSASGTGNSSGSSDPADTNGDGTVSDAERLAYQQKTADSGSDASGVQTNQNDMLKHMLMQLAQAYGGTPSAVQSGSSIAVAA